MYVVMFIYLLVYLFILEGHAIQNVCPHQYIIPVGPGACYCGQAAVRDLAELGSDLLQKLQVDSSCCAGVASP